MLSKSSNKVAGATETFFEAENYKEELIFFKPEKSDTKNKIKTLIVKPSDYQNYHWSKSTPPSIEVDLDIEAIERRSKFLRLNAGNNK